MSQLNEPISARNPDKDLSVADEGAAPSPCYFMVADILGFSQMITNLSDKEQSKRINDWTALVRDTKKQASVRDIQLISDTLFVREEDSLDGLKRLLSFAQLLLNCGIEKSFPLRGAIVHGNTAWGQLTYGKAVIEAHRIERSLDWVGISCAPRLPRLESLWSWDLVVVYPVPKSIGETQLVPVVSWKVPMADELIAKMSREGLVAEGSNYAWKEISKIERTIQFGIYLRLGRQYRLDPKQYRGWFPMHFIEAILTPQT